MLNILCIETSGKACSVALFQNIDLKGFRSVITADFKHAEALHLLIQELTIETGISLKDLHAVAVSQGPGSYTGLRVGVSAAKGLCYALEIPLVAVDTLRLIAVQTKELAGIKVEKYVAMIDARREEVYMQEFDPDLNPISPARAVILDQEPLPFTHAAIGGDGAEKAKKYLQERELVFVPQAIALANVMGAYAFEACTKKEFKDVAYFEPFYLKEFYSKPK